MLVNPFGTMFIIKETGSQAVGSAGTRLKQRRRQTDRDTAAQCPCVRWVTMLLNFSTGPDSGTEVRPSVWRHGILLPIRNNSPPLLSLPRLILIISGWLMDHCRSEFITSTGQSDVDKHHPKLTSSSSSCLPPLGSDIKHTAVSHFYSLWFLLLPGSLYPHRTAYAGDDIHLVSCQTGCSVWCPGA